ncbi:hypothetical protein CIPAW_15G069500 [Carya illinoinensis]|uniref:Uncharacterized protein n=1 Tax=Carya illinoinensis TaxID=32201 RepID=A0A8T1N4X6_CARIL|nr:hypothetical protein CIPAW_15G069500 [Carya illinoinensis]
MTILSYYLVGIGKRLMIAWIYHRFQLSWCLRA